MNALELVKSNYKGTQIVSETTFGLKNYETNNNLDCNCVDCGDSADCSTPW